MQRRPYTYEKYEHVRHDADQTEVKIIALYIANRIIRIYIVVLVL